ncbi:hypothetical protein SAMN05421666_0705 [Roseovarius nanhaiticus]|uniref:Uncharacterized protein n=1 Tax=Roseovarius nanhaiticus TaxID=573024 RepID=A0A1N7F2N5_9RHOB|nr:hypothetical protein [Roseovarius nanhaiticus]SEK62684.1 hypothetical protein SAMN05216208_1430 [Roseovarius nanhaiticus]SIR94617.1 hypothetical protein SAMN05421666_0705 [Roseovarius nanhaiticus]
MHQDSKQERVEAVVDRLIGPRPRNALAFDATWERPRLDTSRPNIHDSKKDFVNERDAVASIVEHLEAAFNELRGSKDDAQHQEMIDRLKSAVDAGARKPQEFDEFETARDLTLQNMVQTGFYFNSLFVIFRMIIVYEERLKELIDQEKQFWSLPYRAPNYYARTIALRLARLYAFHKRQKPPFGTARDGNHPSTDFGRALEEIFAVLGIKAAVRKAAEWAIEQLTEADINPPVNTMGGLLGMDPRPSIEGRQETKSRIADLLTKSPRN